MRRIRVVVGLLVVVLAVPAAGAVATRAEAAPQQQAAGKKVLTIEEYARFRSVVSTAISPDGRWVSYGYRKREADDEFAIRNLDDDRIFAIPRGSEPRFSDDSRWVAYEIALPFEEIEAIEDEGGPVPVQVELLDLQTGEKIGPWDDVSGFAFADSSLALAVKRRRPGGDGGGGGAGVRGRRGGDDDASDDDSPRGSDLIIRYLQGGYEELLGSVDEFAFNKPGTHLAYTVDAADNNGNGIYLIDLRTGARRGLDNGKAEYADLTWDELGTSLAVFKGTIPEGREERHNAVLGFQRVVAPAESTAVAPTNAFAYDGSDDDAFPDDFVISQRGSLAWSSGADKLFFGIDEQTTEPEETDEPIADVNIFHWNDERIQTVQMAQAERDRNFTYLSVLNLVSDGPGTFVRLADERMRVIRPTRDGRWAIGLDDEDYISDWERPRADFYRIDTATGARSLMVRALETRFDMGISPDGKHLLYWKDGHVWDWRLEAGETVNLTASSAAGAGALSFANTDWDYIGERPPWGLAGWSADGDAVILEHKHDLYLQRFDGSRATPLTGASNPHEIRYRIVTLDEGSRVRFPAGGVATLIDLSAPVMLSAFGQWTKKSGYFEIPAGGGEPRPLVWDDKRFSPPRKAKSADRYLYTVQDFTQFPDYWVADHPLGSAGIAPAPSHEPAGAENTSQSGFATPTRVTEANPFQNEYKWGHRVLFEYTNGDGVRLQGTLAIPDDHVEGERRPMIVRFYEKYSQDLHLYPMPRYRHSPNFAGYVSAGYLIMQPDVHFRGGSSHSDMLECVEAATRKVIELGYAEPTAIGLSGHSYSGGGSSFIAGTSEMFAAVASGAAPINLTSEFNQLFLGSGRNNHSYDIHGQGRYGVSPYEDPELYRRESPITYAPEMNTPLLYLHGEEDPTVGYVQGMEWYNALRFNRKPIIFLSYPGEGHGLRRYENQIDFQRRLREFFDHFLRDEPAPDWMTEGVDYLQKERNLKRRKR